MLRPMFSALFVGLLFAGVARSQETPEPAAPQEAAPAESETQAQEAESPSDDVQGDASFAELFAQWKDLLARLRELQIQYQTANPDKRAELEKEFNSELQKGEALIGQLTQAAEAAYAADPAASNDAADFLLSALRTYLGRDQYDDATRVSELLIANEYPNEAIYNAAGVAAFATNQFEVARDHLARAEANDALDGQGQRDNAEVDAYVELWNEEQQRRASEAEADDLPRVVLTTNQGDVVIELFENEAPNTVANFVNLIEKGFYDGLTFHRVIRNFMAQGGCPTGTGTGGPGYNIACECYEEGARKHFRGSLSMAHAGRDTGGSQFFITLRPTSHLNDRHTVFGRVIEGMDNVVALKARDPSAIDDTEPDRIIEAKVLRKRDHEYTPETRPEE